MLRLAPHAFCFLLAILGATILLHPDVVRFETASASPARITVRAAGPGSPGVAFDIPPLAPGDSAATAVDLDSSSPVTLTTTATISSLLDQDAHDGLRLTIERCSVPWVPASVVYRCPGSSDSLLAPRPVLMSDLPILDIPPAATQHLLLSLTLPASAGNEFQGLSSSIQYRFAATNG